MRFPVERVRELPGPPCRSSPSVLILGALGFDALGEVPQNRTCPAIRRGKSRCSHWWRQVPHLLDAYVTATDM